MEQGDLLQDRYRIVRHIKRGGMGAVYEARDTKLAESPCAVKEILETARLGKDSQYIESRFFQEMKALAALDHHSIPKVRDYLTVDSVVYIVMDLVQGQSLEDEIEQSMGLTGNPPDPEKSVQDVLELLDTVAYLHEQTPPVLHRDIKPANILRETRSGRIKLVDFGLARQLDENSSHTLVGTLGYCAPEQMMGKGCFQSDLYSVGVTLHHLLTGTRPESLNFEPLHPDVPGLRPGLAEIVEKATQLRPADRYSNCQQMSEALKAWLHKSPSALGQLPTARQLPASGPARSRLVGGLVAVALALTVGLWLLRKTAPEVPLATPTAAVAVTEPTPLPPVETVAFPVAVPVVAEIPAPAPAPAAPVEPAPAPIPPAQPPAPPPPPRAEVEPEPAYPTYQGPPAEPAVGFQSPQPPLELPEPNLDGGDTPRFQRESNPQANRNRRINRWRNHRRQR